MIDDRYGLADSRQIIRSGDPVDRLPLLVSGALDAVIHQASDDGNPVVPVIWGPGELVMLSYLFRRTPATVDVVVSADASFRWVPFEDIEDTLNLVDDPAHAALREQLTALIHARPDDAGPLREAVGTA